jgi:hypothetical protein
MLRCCCCWLELPASCAVSRPCTLLTLPACLATPPRAADAVPGMHGLARSGSYLQMDTDGRVIRVDSFAKFLAPGLRLGWVTAHPKIVEKLTMIIQVRCRSADEGQLWLGLPWLGQPWLGQRVCICTVS